MPIITKISEQKRRKNRRSIYLDGKFAFGCNVNVVARFRLHEGMVISSDDLQKIEQGELRQECFDRAIKFLEHRQHSRSELSIKLRKYDYPSSVIESVLVKLTELDYINDQRFAETRVELAAKYKHHGSNRARIELMKKGVDQETTRRAIETVYESHDSAADARAFAMRKLKSLARLEPHVAKRRLYGQLLRRGYDYDTIKPVVEEVLGGADDKADET